MLWKCSGVGWAEEEGEVFDRADLYHWFNHQFSELPGVQSQPQTSPISHIQSPNPAPWQESSGTGSAGTSDSWPQTVCRYFMDSPVLPRFARAEHWTEVGLEELTGPPTLCFPVLTNAENYVGSWKRTNVN